MATELAVTRGELTTLLDLLSSSPALSENPENVSYLAELPSLSLSDLLATPTALSTQSHTLTASLTALAHTSYPTFLSLHKTSSALLSSLSSLNTSLNTLLDTALPALDDAARTFREKSGPTVIEERQRARVVLEQHDKLRDLLDVPVLIDTCVRNGLYAEALALAGHASTALSALSSTNIQSQGVETSSASPHASPLQLVRSLQAEVASSLYSMRLLLLNTLHEPSRKLPAFWKAVQFLRRMEVMSESELALAFVSARIECLQNALQAVERDTGASATATTDDGDNIIGSSAAEREKEMDRQADDVARFLRKYVDVWREGAYDIITQYTTIFLERSQHRQPSLSHSSTTPLLPDPVIQQTLPPTLLGLLLPTVRTYLRHAYPHLAPLATQLAYCSSAMTRVGMDFRALLSPLITRAVVDGFARDLRIGAEREWAATLSKYSSPSQSKPTAPSKWLVSSSHPLPPLSSISIQPSSAVHTPPQILTTFSPLAVYLNTHLRALNRLRALAPMDALGGVSDALESVLEKNGKEFLGYAREWRGGAKEAEIIRAAGIAYTRVLVPFLRRAVVEGVFGESCDSDGQNGEQREVNGTMRVDGGSALSVVLRDWESWLGDSR
ncbi:hypothetical protein PAXRUDRAFT_821262 [Paxillus rubicundulus Ve08.2h10]|uniref:Conserved oligomeric Golgi complex subunit 8 n=1 Tax=Paxillus rubicundulus Ve08.2h10 TaxID=930991 RepID=A0A0D0DP63_9AGAM|nr:hypothetical protein PAXRUDRAFT_821262 [Paxillus rubicundulus Ve08.2h10]